MKNPSEQGTRESEEPHATKKPLNDFSTRTKFVCLSLLTASSVILVVLLSIIAYFYVQRGYLFYPLSGKSRTNNELYGKQFPPSHSHTEPAILDSKSENPLVLDVPNENEKSSIVDSDSDLYFKPAGTFPFVEGPSRMNIEANFEESLGGIKGPTVDLVPDYDFPAQSFEATPYTDFPYFASDKEFGGPEARPEVPDHDQQMYTMDTNNIVVASGFAPAKSNANVANTKHQTGDKQAKVLDDAGNARQQVLSTAEESAVTTPLSQEPKLEPHAGMKLYRVLGTGPIGAVCLDGSAPAYYHRTGVGNSAKLWIIHFNGGAWCFDPKACLERSRSSLGSTKNLPPSPPIVQGINSDDPAINPDFYDWNLVWVVYCDGASFTGNRDKPLVVDGHIVYMRGRRVLNAILSDLMQNRDLKLAEAVILTGSSAGSMTAMFQADYIASKFPKTTPVRVLSDAGFFLETAPLGGKNVGAMFKGIYDMQNSSGGLNQECVRQVGIADGWQCFLPARALKYIKTPMFILNSAYDFWALLYFLGVDCKFPTASASSKNRRSANEQAATSSHSTKLFASREGERQEESRPTNEKEALQANRRKSAAFNNKHSFIRSQSKLIPRNNSIGATYSNRDVPLRSTRDISGYEILPYFRRSEGERTILPIRNLASGNLPPAQKYENSSLESDRHLKRTPRNISESANHLQNLSIPLERGEPIRSNSIAGDALKKLMDELSGKAEPAVPEVSFKNISSTTISNNYNLTIPFPSAENALMAPLTVVDQLASEGNTSIEAIYHLHRNSSSFPSVALPPSRKLRKVLQLPNGQKNLTFNPAEDNHIEMERRTNNLRSHTVTKPPMHRTPSLSRLTFLKHDRTQTGRRRTANTTFYKKALDHRSTSIAREYINILRSDPPECTEKEIRRAMTYRAAIIKATDEAIKRPKSARFLVSCIDHSISLFDETWTNLMVNGQSVQQVFGDWFYERGPESKYNFVDCPWPCNKSCP